jgi:hypothetical protein
MWERIISTWKSFRLVCCCYFELGRLQIATIKAIWYGFRTIYIWSALRQKFSKKKVIKEW